MQTQDAPQAKKTSWIRWFGTLAAAGLLVYLVIDQGWQALVDSLAHISWSSFLLSFFFVFCSRLATIGRWHVLLRSASVPITPAESIRLVFAGLFAANFLPTTVGGDLVRFAGAVRLHYDAGVAAASLVMDRLVGMAGMATVLPIGLVRFFSQPLPGASTFLQVPMLATGFVARAWQWLAEKLRSLFQSVLRAMRLWLSRPRALLLAYLFTLGHMFFTFLATWYLFQVMGEDVSFWLVAGLWSMSYFVTLLPVSVNGMGVQELSISFFFTQYAHVSAPSALALAILMRALPLMASLPGAFFVPALLEPRRKAQ